MQSRRTFILGRAGTEAIEEDPEGLEQVRARRRLLYELRRKYGATLAHVITYAEEARDRLAELEDHDRRAATIDAELAEARDAVRAAATGVARARREAAPRLGAAVEAHLRELAMPGARFEVGVDDRRAGRTTASARAVDGDERIVELSRMLSGQPESRAAQDHAEELLAAALRERGR